MWIVDLAMVPSFLGKQPQAESTFPISTLFDVEIGKSPVKWKFPIRPAMMSFPTRALEMDIITINTLSLPWQSTTNECIITTDCAN